MRYPWLPWIVLAVVAASALVGWAVLARRPRSAPWRGWLANTGYLRDLPRYGALLRRARLGAAGLVAALAVLVVATSQVAGAPVDRRTEDQRLASRDIVLCLDASGSMIPYDGRIASTFDKLVGSFDGERISLQIFSAQSVVLFPLTDDYDLARETLTRMGDVMQRGYLGSEGNQVFVTQELQDYLSGIDAPEGQMVSSLSGDGLASCVTGFDVRDQKRSRTVILATDNEVLGPQIYTLAQAVQFARKNDVRVIALSPKKNGYLTSDAEQMRTLVLDEGGLFYDASDPSAVSGILDRIESDQKTALGGAVRTLQTDRPGSALAWAAVGLLGLLVFAAWGRL